MGITKSSRPAACPALLCPALPCSVTTCSKTVFLQNVLLLLMSAWVLLVLQHFCQCPHHTLLSDCCYNTDCHNCLLKQPRCLQLPWPPLCSLSFFVTSWRSSSATVLTFASLSFVSPVLLHLLCPACHPLPFSTLLPMTQQPIAGGFFCTYAMPSTIVPLVPPLLPYTACATSLTSSHNSQPDISRLSCLGGIQNRFGSLFFILIYMSVMSLSSLPLWMEDRLLFIRSALFLLPHQVSLDLAYSLGQP